MYTNKTLWTLETAKRGKRRYLDDLSAGHDRVKSKDYIRDSSERVGWRIINRQRLSAGDMMLMDTVSNKLITLNPKIISFL